MVDKNGGWNQYKNLSEKSKKLERERFLLEKKEVLMHATDAAELETVVLARNLPLIHPPHIVGKYEKLKTLEKPRPSQTDIHQHGLNQ